MQKTLKTTKTHFNARKHYIQFFRLYDFYFAHVLDPVFMLVQVGTRFFVQCFLFDAQIECNRSFKDIESAHFYYENFFVKILERFVAARKKYIKENNKADIVNTQQIIEHKTHVDKKTNDNHMSKMYDKNLEEANEASKNNIKNTFDMNFINENMKNIYNTQNNNTQTGNYKGLQNKYIHNNEIQNTNFEIVEDEKNIKKNFKYIFDALNMQNINFEILYIKLQDKYKSVLCVNDQAHFGELFNTKKKAAESALSTYLESLHVMKATSDLDRDKNKILYKNQQNKAYDKNSILYSRFESVPNQNNYNYSKNNETIEYVGQKSTYENNKLQNLNITHNIEENNKKIVKYYDAIDDLEFDFFSYINDFCINKRMHFPEYCLEKQNDVYICKAEFDTQNFTSKYFFNRNDAKKDVCRLIYNYINKNKLENNQILPKVENGNYMYKDNSNKMYNSKKKHSDEISVYSKKLIENMTEHDFDNYAYEYNKKEREL